VAPTRQPKGYAIPRIRQAVRLRDEGKSYRQIAAKLGISCPSAWRLVQNWTEWVHERRIDLNGRA
jgi:hypothetical protein